MSIRALKYLHMLEILKALAGDERCPIDYIIDKLIEQNDPSAWGDLLLRPNLTIPDLEKIKQNLNQNQKISNTIILYLQNKFVTNITTYKDQSVWPYLLNEFPIGGRTLAIRSLDWDNPFHVQELLQNFFQGEIWLLFNTRKVPGDVALSLASKFADSVLPYSLRVRRVNIQEKDTITNRQQEYINKNLAESGYHFRDHSIITTQTKPPGLPISIFQKALRTDDALLATYIDHLISVKAPDLWEDFIDMKVFVPPKVQWSILESQDEVALRYLAKVSNLDKQIWKELEKNWDIEILFCLADRPDCTQEEQEHIKNILNSRNTDWIFWANCLKDFTPLAQQFIIKVLETMPTHALEFRYIVNKLACSANISLETENWILNKCEAIKKNHVDVIQLLGKNPNTSWETIIRIIKIGGSGDAEKRFLSLMPDSEVLLSLVNEEKSHETIFEKLEILSEELQRAICTRGKNEELKMLARHSSLETTLQPYLANGEREIQEILSTRSDLTQDTMEILWRKEGVAGGSIKNNIVKSVKNFNYALIDTLPSVTNEIALRLACRKDLPVEWMLKLSKWKTVDPRLQLVLNSPQLPEEVATILVRDSSTTVRKALRERSGELSLKNFEIFIKKVDKFFFTLDELAELPDQHIRAWCRKGGSGMEILKLRYIKSGALYQNHQGPGGLYAAISLLLDPEVPLDLLYTLVKPSHVPAEVGRMAL
jgi:hypothetical protein